jgi:hypothetical protein
MNQNELTYIEAKVESMIEQEQYNQFLEEQFEGWLESKIIPPEDM